MQRTKLILIAIVVILFCIIFLQNTQSVETKILFMSITMPRAVLLILAVLIGFIGGFVFAYFLKKTRGQKPEMKSKATIKDGTS